MISFDNGPANGDYVRYIDDLMREAAAFAAASVRRNADATAASGGWTGGADTPGRRAMQESMQESPRTTGFTPPPTETSATSAASAIASALMSGQVAPSLRSLQSKLALAAIALGVILAGVGLLWQPLSLPFVIGGIALVAWAARTLKDGIATSARPGS